MVPAMALGPAVASGVRLLHSHGSDGLHEHVLTVAVAHGPHGHGGLHPDHALDDHAAHVDGHGHDLLHDSLHGHMPPDSQFGVPVAAWPGLVVPRTALSLSRMLSWESEGQAFPLTVHRTGLQPANQSQALRQARPAHRGHGSGTARVLRSSHALLI
jgi:hypothetical protein